MLIGKVAVLAAHYRNLIDMGFANHAYQIQCQGFAPLISNTELSRITLGP